MNLPAVVGLSKVIRRPSICLPHYIVPTFADIPTNFNDSFKRSSSKQIDIKAVVLDKDNCFAVPGQDAVDPSCRVRTRLPSGYYTLSTAHMP